MAIDGEKVSNETVPEMIKLRLTAGLSVERLTALKNGIESNLEPFDKLLSMAWSEKPTIEQIVNAGKYLQSEGSELVSKTIETMDELVVELADRAFVASNPDLAIEFAQAYREIGAQLEEELG